MTVQEVVEKVRSERKTPGRFPARIIFVRDFSDYSLLVDELEKECDVTINLACYVRGDRFPRFRDLQRDLEGHANKTVLVLSVGEYLRLCSKRERVWETSVFPGFWRTMQAEHLTTKYILPLFGGRELLETVMPVVDERQRDFLWEVRSETGISGYLLKVFSPDFAGSVQADASSLEEWLSRWDTLYANSCRREFVLISSLVKYTDSSVGTVNVKVVDEPFRYVVSLVTDGRDLCSEWGPPDFWADVAGHVRQGLRLAETIKVLLNVGEMFDPVTLLAVFAQLSPTSKRLLWIWYRLYPDNSYYSVAIRSAEHPEDIPVRIRDAVFDYAVVEQPTLEERARALRVLNINYGCEYFSRLDKVLPVWERFSYLTYRTLEEQAYAIKTVSELLRNDADVSEIAEYLRGHYPDLAGYLFPAEEEDSAIRSYFIWYRVNKVLNRPPEAWPNRIDFEDIDSRHKILVRHGDKFAFWIDGLGAEWLPLLARKLQRLPEGKSVKTEVGRALLPTETSFNRKWKETDQKWDRLDEVSHNGLPDDKDYFLCIARQLQIMDEIVNQAAELLKLHGQIVITGDHGSSRLAALMFHVADNFPIEPPPGSKVRAYGRYCELTDSSFLSVPENMQRVDCDNQTYLVMKTYEHFKYSGNAAGGNTDEKAVAGEIHGGMTPEEYLVPVILVTSRLGRGHLQAKKNTLTRPAVVNNMGI